MRWRPDLQKRVGIWPDSVKPGGVYQVHLSFSFLLEKGNSQGLFHFPIAERDSLDLFYHFQVSVIVGGKAGKELEGISMCEDLAGGKTHGPGPVPVETRIQDPGR